MKLGARFKAVLLATGAALCATGVAVRALASLFLVDRGLGPEPAPARAAALKAHSVLGLAFLVLFGYLWRAHVEPGLAHKRRRRSGLALVAALAVVFLTVPLLFYASGDAVRSAAAAVHTWLGAALLLPLLVHLNAKKS